MRGTNTVLVKPPQSVEIAAATETLALGPAYRTRALRKSTCGSRLDVYIRGEATAIFMADCRGGGHLERSRAALRNGRSAPA